MSSWRKGLLLLDRPFLHQPSLLDLNPLQQLHCRLIIGVLRHKSSTHRQVEDGLTQLLDVLDAGGEAREVVKVKAGGRGQGGDGVGADAVQARRRQPVALRLTLVAGRLQLVAQGHQFIDLGDDAVLFGEGGEGDNKVLNIFPRNSWY